MSRLLTLTLLLTLCTPLLTARHHHHHKHHHSNNINRTSIDIDDVDDATRDDETANPHARSIRRAAAERDHQKLNNPIEGTFLSMKLRKDKAKLPRIMKRHEQDGARMIGSLYDTYLATVTIRGDEFTCIMDTGSSDFAVAASKQCNCSTYYKGKCDGVALEVAYGDGNWTGNGCKDKVSIDGFQLGDVTFAGMKTQYDMLECASGNEQNGIIGLAFPPLLGPPTDYTKPFFDLLVDNNEGMTPVFGMQCCMWIDQEIDGLKHAEGRLDLGYVDPTHYAGPIVYTPITEKVFYTVDLIDVKVGTESVWPQYRPGRDPKRSPPTVNDKHHHYHHHHHHHHPHRRPHPHHKNITKDDPQSHLPYAPDTIIDSGTSNLIFTQDTYDNILAALKKHQPNQPDGVWKGETCVPHGTHLSESWPTISLTFAGEPGEPDFDLIVPPCRYLVRAPESECDNHIPGHAFSIDAGELSEGNIFGQVLFEAYYVVHDLRGSGRVGFAQLAGCKDTPGCSNQEIHILEHTLTAVPSASSQADMLSLHTPTMESASSPLTVFLYLCMFVVVTGIIVRAMIYKVKQQEYISLV